MYLTHEVCALFGEQILQGCISPRDISHKFFKYVCETLNVFTFLDQNTFYEYIVPSCIANCLVDWYFYTTLQRTTHSVLSHRERSSQIQCHD